MHAVTSPARRTLLVVMVTAMVAAGATAAALLLTRQQAPPQPAVTVAVVGDDYTAGRLNQVVWPTLLAQRTGWSVANFALPGAGFAADEDTGYAVNCGKTVNQIAVDIIAQFKPGPTRF